MSQTKSVFQQEQWDMQEQEQCFRLSHLLDTAAMILPFDGGSTRATIWKCEDMPLTIWGKFSDIERVLVHSFSEICCFSLKTSKSLAASSIYSPDPLARKRCYEHNSHNIYFQIELFFKQNPTLSKNYFLQFFCKLCVCFDMRNVIWW